MNLYPMMKVKGNPMSDMPSVDEVVDVLLSDPDPIKRQEAARMLADLGPSLNDEDYHLARESLNRALADPDPMVLTTAMQMMSMLPPRPDEEDLHDDEEPEEEAVLETNTCAVCGKPEILIDPEHCQYEDECPYR